MADLTVSYMGIELSNPVVVAACSLSSKVDTIKRIEEYGAGAMVIKSLFEEQIRHEAGTLDEMLGMAGAGGEAVSFFPQLEPAGARTHLMWVEKARAAVKMPLIASLNAVSNDTWVEYAQQLADTGVNGLELNTYAIEADASRDAAAIEDQLLGMVGAVREQSKLPLCVKLSPYYTSVASVIGKLDAMGVNAVVTFNRFFQPDINPDTEELFNKMTWSTEAEMRVPLRWIALLYGRVGLDLVANTGVQEPKDVVKYLLAGATAVQVAGVLFRRKPEYLKALIGGLGEWMDAKGYGSLEEFRGKLSQENQPGNAAAFERAQYLEFLLRANGERVSA